MCAKVGEVRGIGENVLGNVWAETIRKHSGVLRYNSGRLRRVAIAVLLHKVHGGLARFSMLIFHPLDILVV
jgi:hypothetical protein